MPPIHNVLEPAPKAAEAASKTEQGAYLDHLNKRAGAGGHGVSLGDMTPEEIRARLLGD